MSRKTKPRVSRRRRPPPRRRLHFERLNDTQFEDFCFDLLDAVGYVNIDWRKGTGKKTSPADRGRDIVCQEHRHDVDGSVHLETVFADCKHLKRGVPPRELQNLLDWAQAERPDTALFIVSDFLSNGAKDYLEAYRLNQRPAFKIKVWERPTLEKLGARRIGVARRHGLIDDPIRSVQAILRAEKEMFDKVWYDRHQTWMALVRAGMKEQLDPRLLQTARRAAERIEKQYGKGMRSLGPWTSFDWGVLNGKLSALRWVLGSEWDFLDT